MNQNACVGIEGFNLAIALRVRLRLVCLGMVLFAGYCDAFAQTRADVKMAQKNLVGYDVGVADGSMTTKTINAIKAYQNDWQIAVTGKVTPELVSRLARTHPATRPQWFKTDNQDCRVWNNNPRARETVTWSGECVDEKAHGTGTLVWAYIERGNSRQSTYYGDLRDGTKHGHGTFTWAGGNRYEGDYRNGKKHGQGIEIWADGSSYTGGYVDGKQQGRGVYSWPDGSRYEGDYLAGKRNGHGAVTWSNGGSYVGEYVNGVHHGRGVETWPSGDRYEGGYKDGKQHGLGTLTWATGDRYTGFFVNGLRHGIGKCTPATGDAVPCRWEHGQQVE